MYVKGSILCRPQLASSKTKVALTSPPSSLPTKSQFFRPNHLAAEVHLRDVVVHGQAAVVEVATERDALVPRVSDPLRDGRLVEDAAGLAVAPVEERLDDGRGAGVGRKNSNRPSGH